MEINLKIKIKDQVLELTEDEAKELYAHLDDMFGAAKMTFYPVGKHTDPWWVGEPYVTYSADSRTAEITIGK